MYKLSEGQQWYIDDLKAAHAAGFTVMYRPSQGCCWVQCIDPNWSNHPDCYTMEPDERGRWVEYKQTRDCVATTGKPHPHAALIKQWADGAVIQCRMSKHDPFEDAKEPRWLGHWEYRVKPQETDLQKYGVEVGDVWAPSACYPQARYANTVGSVQVNRINTVGGNLMTIGNSDVLLFRRGVVNKL
jgi:hypothetical protein